MELRLETRLEHITPNIIPKCASLWVSERAGPGAIERPPRKYDTQALGMVRLHHTPATGGTKWPHPRLFGPPHPKVGAHTSACWTLSSTRTRAPRCTTTTYREITGPTGYIARRVPFKGNSMRARIDGDFYFVYSYSTCIASVRISWTKADGECAYGGPIVSSDRYSVTTSRHQNICRAWL